MQMTLAKLPGALLKAQHDADASCIPQTVYRSPNTYGWANTWNGARLLDARDVRMHATILPARYFAR